MWSPHQEQAEDLPRRDPHFLPDRVSQRGANGKSKKGRTRSAAASPRQTRLIVFSTVSPSKLVCEDVNVDRFFPVLYPKVRSSLVCVEFIFRK